MVPWGWGHGGCATVLLGTCFVLVCCAYNSVVFVSIADSEALLWRKKNRQIAWQALKMRAFSFPDTLREGKPPRQHEVMLTSEETLASWALAH